MMKRNTENNVTNRYTDGAGINYVKSHNIIGANVITKKDGTKIIRTASGLVKVQKSIFQ